MAFYYFALNKRTTHPVFGTVDRPDIPAGIEYGGSMAKANVNVPEYPAGTVYWGIATTTELPAWPGVFAQDKGSIRAWQVRNGEKNPDADDAWFGGQG